MRAWSLAWFIGWDIMLPLPSVCSVERDSLLVWFACSGSLVLTLLKKSTILGEKSRSNLTPNIAWSQFGWGATITDLNSKSVCINFASVYEDEMASQAFSFLTLQHKKIKTTFKRINLCKPNEIKVVVDLSSWPSSLNGNSKKPGYCHWEKSQFDIFACLGEISQTDYWPIMGFPICYTILSSFILMVRIPSPCSWNISILDEMIENKQWSSILTPFHFLIYWCHLYQMVFDVRQFTENQFPRMEIFRHNHIIIRFKNFQLLKIESSYFSRISSFEELADIVRKLLLFSNPFPKCLIFFSISCPLGALFIVKLLLMRISVVSKRYLQHVPQLLNISTVRVIKFILTKHLFLQSFRYRFFEK